MWLLLALACAPKDVPPYLEPESRAPVAAVVDPSNFSDVSGALAALVADDPLVRRPVAAPADRYAALPGGEPLAAWARANQGVPNPEKMPAVERRYRGTAAVALARGAQLAIVETQLLYIGPNPHLPREEDLAALPWVSPLLLDERTPPADAASPLGWLGPLDPADARKVLVRHAERRVLLGWLDAPSIPLEAVAHAFKTGVHDRLLEEPAGALVRARGLGQRAPDQAAAGRALLERATTLALLDVAADRDSEQQAWRQQREATRVELGLSESQDPIAHLLEGAFAALVQDASDDTSAGLALVALSARRLRGPCPTGVCRDLDRTASLSRAELWGADVVPAARAWQLIALKGAVDTVEVSIDRPSFNAGLPELIDALIGTGEGAFPAGVLRRRGPSPQLLLDLSRGMGGPDQMDAVGLMANLKARLAVVAARALEGDPKPEWSEPLTRVRERAARP